MLSNFSRFSVMFAAMICSSVALAQVPVVAGDSAENAPARNLKEMEELALHNRDGV